MPPATKAKTTRSTPRRNDPAERRSLVAIADLREITSVSAPVFSPDGERIAFVARRADAAGTYRTNIWLANADGAAARRFTSAAKDAHPHFTPDGAKLIFVSNRSGSPQFHAIPTDGGEAVILSDLPEGTIRSPVLSPTGDRIAFAFRPTPKPRTKEEQRRREERNASEPPVVIDHLDHKMDGDGFFAGARFSLRTLDINSRAHHTIETPTKHDRFSFDFAPTGNTIVLTINRHKQAALEPRHTELVLVDAATGDLRTIPGLPEGIKSSPKWSPDGKTIAYAGRTGDDGAYSTRNLDLYVTTPNGGNARNLTKGSDHCLLAVSVDDSSDAEFEPNLRFSPDSTRVYYRVGLRGATQIASVPRRGGEPTLHTAADAEHDLGAFSPDGERLAVVHTSPTAPSEIALIGAHAAPAVRTKNTRKTTTKPPKTDAATRLTSLNDTFVRTRHLVMPEDLPVVSADGTPVHTRVIFPPAHAQGRSKTCPAILSIHGGPHAQYGSGFFHEFQTLAAAGYAVVYPNPRGSKGYGEAYCDAIKGRWGTVDWEDVRAVIDAMLAHPRIDSERMAVIGGSYGGYMVNWTIARSRDFRAAVTDRCVSNLTSFMGNTDMVQKPGRYFPGRFFDDDEALRACSPIREFAGVRTPTLVIHSEGDLRCNVEQSEQVFTALKLLGVPTRFVRYPRSTSHGMSRSGPPDLREHRLSQMLEWIDRHTAKRGRRRG